MSDPTTPPPPPTDEPKLHTGPGAAAGGHHWRCPNAHPWLEEALEAFAIERTKAAAAAIGGDINPWIAICERVLGQVDALVRFGEDSAAGSHITSAFLNLADRIEARDRRRYDGFFADATQRAAVLTALAREARGGGADQPLSEDAFMSLLDRVGLVEPPEPTAPTPGLWDALPQLLVQQFLLPLLQASDKSTSPPGAPTPIEVREVGALGVVTDAAAAAAAEAIARVMPIDMLVTRLVAGGLIKSEEVYADSQVPRFYLVQEAYTAAERLFRAAGIEPEPKVAPAPDVEDLNREPVRP